MKKETNIDSVEIKSFEKFLQFLYDAKFTDDFIFRGVNDIDYELIPKIGREVYVKKRECKIVCVNRYCMNLLYAPYWGKQR